MSSQRQCGPFHLSISSGPDAIFTESSTRSQPSSTMGEKFLELSWRY